MHGGLEELFDGLNAPDVPDGDRPIYAVARISPDAVYYVGKDKEHRACILIEVSKIGPRVRAPIRLESLEVQFDVPSLIRAGTSTREGVFIVLRCRSADREVVRYFLSVCESIIRLLGDKPSHPAVADAVNRLALIFQKLRSPPSESLNGLFGELLLIRRSREPSKAIAAWRLKDVSRFDFAEGDLRLEMKTAAGRVRAHSFSYDQCNPPPGTRAVVGSVFVERIAGGLALHELIGQIEHLISSSAESVVKLHDVVAATLGSTMPEALAVRFDDRLAASSLEFYDLRSVPAIRNEPPAGVSDIHFRSDLSGSQPLSTVKLEELGFSDFLPSGKP